jgi:hypothetical protein
MKAAILLFLAVSGVLNVFSYVTIGSADTIAVSFLPETMAGGVPATYFYGTIAAAFCVVGLALIGRSWERDSLPAKFIGWTKVVALVELSASLLPAMIFLGVLIEEIQR